MRKILAAALSAIALVALAAGPVGTQTFGFSTRAIQEFSKALTGAGRFGVPRYATAALPTCGASNRGAIVYDTTLSGLYVCVPNTWTSTGLSLTSLNEFTGQTNISGPDATTNVEIGSAANDANAGTGGTSTVVGNNASNSGNAAGAICIGSACSITATGINNVVIGTGSAVQGVAGSSHIKIGPSGTCSSTGNNNIMIGNTVTCLTNSANSLMIGATAVNTGSNQAVFGGAGFGYNDVWFGEGVVDTSAVGWVLHGTGGSGSDNAGGDISIQAGLGTGSSAGSQVNIDRALMRATGSTAQSAANAITACESKTLSNASATATAIATVALASNSSGAARITVSVQCNDGTNFDSDVVTSYVAFVNKATVVTVGTPVTTASAAANNSGSCTVAPTWVANGNTIDIKVTPVITTIVPTTVTAYVNVENLGAGAVTCN